MRPFILTLLVLLLVIPTIAQTDTDGERICYERFGQWDAENQTCFMEMGLTLRVAYPLELLDNEYIISVIEPYLENLRADFANIFAENGFPSPAPWSLYVTYEIYEYSEDIVTVKFDISEYTGGAHPNLYFNTMTFDLTNQQILSFTDLFQEDINPLTTIAPLAQEQLGEVLGTDEMTMQWIIEGTGDTNFENYRNFAVTDAGLMLFFEPYQVAPYAAGPQTMTIDWETLDGIVKSSFVS
jgi:hypothetical protein